MKTISRFIHNEVLYVLDGFGYTSIEDFLQSTFHYPILKTIMLFSYLLGSLAVYFEVSIGLKPIVYLAFLLLIIIETVTGITASVREGHKVESRKFGRMIVKVGVYTFIIALINIFKNNLSVPDIFGLQFNLYEWIYYVILNMIIIQLIISVLENLGRLGFSETSKVIKFMNRKLGKYIDMDRKSTNDTQDETE